MQVVTREYTINMHKRLHGIGFKYKAPRAVKVDPWKHPCAIILTYYNLSGDQEVRWEADGHQGCEDWHKTQQGHLGPGFLNNKTETVTEPIS